MIDTSKELELCKQHFPKLDWKILSQSEKYTEYEGGSESAYSLLIEATEYGYRGELRVNNDLVTISTGELVSDLENVFWDLMQGCIKLQEMWALL